ncbi:type IV secretion system DNA-binding domain-containing protein [Streptomyces marincola]|uniref:FtsK domain-containing protein n=1 Tax=Streptomyces marincola TaxID=2878388 RepID=A0A1W7CYW1_9ACTN|nr:type IV secretion system DNA-binding domain-containing protein [Streptomyces marincola]ARQ69974.1 hypothetical protein CAG99_14895 [Streptomyces marincola]
MSGNKNKNHARVDWSAGHGILSGTVNATAGTLVTTSLAHAAGMPPGWALLAGTAGAAGTLTSGIRRHLTRASSAFRSSCWMAAGLWSSWALSEGSPFSLAAVGSLAAGSIAAGTLARGFEAHEVTEQARRTALLTIGTRRALAAEWIDRLARVCRIEGAEIIGIEHWPTGTGYTLEVKLPQGGVTRKAIADRGPALASDLDLPTGCGIQIRDGLTRRLVLIKVTTKSLAGTDLAFPVGEMAEVTTVNNPIPLALLADGGRADLDLRQASTIVAGTTGSGKTNWLHTLIARLNQTNDTLVWVIDLNGGSLALPWLHAWREAQTEGTSRWAQADIPTPGVDWVASTPTEAKRMLAAAVRIAKARKVAYQQHMRDADDDKLPVGPTLPEIVIIVDESAEVSAEREARQVMDGISQVIRIARAMAIRAVVSALRVTQDVLPDPMVRKMASNRVCTGATEDSELGHFFGWRAMAVEDSFDGPGSLLVGTDGKAPEKGRAARITPGLIEEVCATTATRRPSLDRPSLDAAGPDYETRWLLDRCGHLWNTPQPATAGATADTGPAADGKRAWKATAGWDTPREPTLDTPSVNELEAMFNAPAADKTNSNDSGDNGNTDWSDPSTWTTDRDQHQPDARDAALKLIIAAGPTGTGASAMERALKDDHGTRRPVIQRWLKEWAEAGEIVRVGDGTKARYVHRTHASDDPNQD